MARRQSHLLPSQSAVSGLWWEDDYRNPEFMRTAMPASRWDERLIAHIDNRLVLEADASSVFDAFADTGDPQIRYLAGLIAADEYRHHSMLLALATLVRSTECRQGGELEYGEPRVFVNDQRDSLLKETKRLLDIASEDTRELNEVLRDVRLAPEGTLWPEVVEVMLLDTEKHIQILKAIEQKLKRR